MRAVMQQLGWGAILCLLAWGASAQADTSNNFTDPVLRQHERWGQRNWIRPAPNGHLRHDGERPGLSDTRSTNPAGEAGSPARSSFWRQIGTKILGPAESNRMAMNFSTGREPPDEALLAGFKESGGHLFSSSARVVLCAQLRSEYLRAGRMKGC